MLVGDDVQYVKASFNDEAEIEQVVQDHAELLFGSVSIYLPKRKITTIGGAGSIPDGFVIDLENDQWYVVEVERGAHGTWTHIAPQVSKQLAAVAHEKTREQILTLALEQIEESPRLRGMLREIGLRDIAVHGRIQAILKELPTIAIPIDEVPADLLEWAETLRNEVRIWEIQKFIREDTDELLYLLPEDATPTVITTGLGEAPASTRRGGNLFQRVLQGSLLEIGETLYMEYGPRGEKKQKFEARVQPDGLEVDGKTFSPSYAAVHCIRKAGSDRRTANGWIIWRKLDAGGSARRLPLTSALTRS